jgi:hypothetical protein
MSGNTDAVTQHCNQDNNLTPTHTPTPNTPGEHGIHMMWFFCEQIHCVQQRTSFSFHVTVFNVLFLVLDLKSVMKC